MDTRTGEIFRSYRGPTEEARRRLENAARDGHLVEVSASVADLMEKAHKAEAKAKRKATKAARKKNR